MAVAENVRRWVIEQWKRGRKPTEIGRSVGLSRHQVRRILAKDEADPLGSFGYPERAVVENDDDLLNTLSGREDVKPGDTVWLRPGTYSSTRLLDEVDRQLFGGARPALYQPETPLEPILIVPDTHVPRHHKPSWRLMLRVASVLKPKHIVVIGDLADFTAVSDHAKTPNEMARFEYEVKEVRKALDDLDGLGATNKLYCEGNHEDRLHRYLQSKAAELYDMIDVEELLNLDGRGWRFIPYHQHATLGKVYVTHDVGTSTRYSAYRAMEAFEHSVITGHSHRMAYVVEGNALGETKVSAQFGWLGDIAQMDYSSRGKASKDWALGFGVGYLDPATGYVYLVPVPIVRGTCVVNGVKYEAA